MDRIDRYILRHMAGPFFGALVGVLALLMLERLLRVIDLVGANNGPIGFVFDMLASLMPHYLGMALPAALFLACYVTYRNLAQNSELAALASLGRSLGRLAAPAIAAGVVLALLSGLVHSHLQPHGRYAYRTLKFLVANASIATALEAGAFVEFNGVTFMADEPGPDGAGLGRVFLHERRPDGGRRTVTSSTAALIEDPEGPRAAIEFKDGLLVDDRRNGERSTITFEQFNWPIDRGALGEFRPRGLSEAELTWPELAVELADPEGKISKTRVAAELNGSMARALTALFIPFLAIPLAVMGGRTRSSMPLAVGVIVFLLYQQGMQFVEGFAELGRAPAAATIWSLFGVVATASLLLFLRAWRSVDFQPRFSLPRTARLRRRPRERKATA